MKKFRGQHRYYRRLKVGTPAVHRKMDKWIHYLENGQSQYDYDHIHFDCSKQPLFRWNAIRQHLDAMMCSFNVIAMKRIITYSMIVDIIIKPLGLGGLSTIGYNI